MISDEVERIASQLDDIEDRYNEAEPGSDDASVFALAYILILSSWIEECRNSLSCRLVDDFFAGGDVREKIKKRIRQINGVKFSEHFKRAITVTVGEHGYYEVKSNCDERTMVLLESALGFIWDARCDAAHNTFSGLQRRTFRAPSVIRPRRDEVFRGLMDLERSICSLNRNVVA